MKVTVTFGDTAVVVPCKAGWTVRDLMDQAARRYRRILEQHGEKEVKMHHLEYMEGGILYMEDPLSDLVEDRDKLVAVFEEVQAGRRSESPAETMSNGRSTADPSPEPSHYYPHLEYRDADGGEIEVNEAVLKANTPLLVRSSSDSALAPPLPVTHTPPSTDYRNGSPDPEIDHVLSAAQDQVPAKMSQVNYSTLTRAVEFPGAWAPLGIHVVPYCSSLSGRPLGLHIKGIEEGSRARREGIFREDECIVQINDTPLQDKTFAQSQEVFRQAMNTPSVRLEVLPVANKPRYEKSLIGQLFTGDFKDPAVKAKSPMVARTKADLQPEPRQDPRAETRRPEARAKTPEPTLVNAAPVELQARLSSQDRASPAPATRPESTSPTPRPSRGQSPPPPASKNPALPGLASLTNRKGGKRVRIDLKKGAEGLGFTVVTRDSSVHGPGPILVKNILPRGAAIKDGRLQPGDRILEVNGVDMAGRSQEELVAMLRSTKQGESVCVVVARQEDIFLPRELKGEDSGSLLLEDGREQLMYEIPLNETGSAGLGVSLKGNKSRETGEDLGIFIKSIIHGGAAYKDGRLSVNDQMIAVNGESLLGRSNHAAMETLRRSMSSEGNSRGTIQLVVLRAPRQMPGSNLAPNGAPSASQQPGTQTSSANQEQWGHGSYQGPSRPPSADPALNGAGHAPVAHNNHFSSGSAPVANGGYGRHGNGHDHDHDDHDDYYEEEEDPGQGFPPPPSPGSVEEMNRDLPLTPPPHSEFQRLPDMTEAFYGANDNRPRNRASKSMDLVADESNMGSLVGQRDEPSAAGALGPTLGLWKSSSLESLQTAMSEAHQSRVQAQVPFHRPRPHMVRGRGVNQSFRNAIDKSYEGPSEDDDDMSEQSSGHETPASSSSRQDLDADDGKKKKKKTKAKKKEKKTKGKKKSDDNVEEQEKKTKRKGFGLLRFGKKKEDKSKDAAKASKNKLEALSEEELDRIPDSRDGRDPRYAEVRPGRATPDRRSLPDVEDDDFDPTYARINSFQQAPPQLHPTTTTTTPSSSSSPQTFLTRTPSPPAAAAAATAAARQPHVSSDELDGLYAKVNKPRAPHNQTQADSDQRLQGLRRDPQQARAAPGYEELDAARRRVLEHDPHRMAPRESAAPAHRYDDRYYPTQPRRDPYDYPTHSRPVPRDSAPYPGYNQEAPPSGRVPLPQTGDRHHHHHQQQQQRGGPLRQDVPPSPTGGRRARNYYEAAGGRLEEYRQAGGAARYADPDHRYDYGEERQPDPRRKNPVIGAV